MRRNRSIQTTAVIPVLTYPDVREAAAWLCAALGFSERLRIGDGHRVQLTYGDGALTIAEAAGDRAAPASAVTHSVTLRVGDASEACERARERDATILMEPTDTHFGERQCGLVDPWGHRWTLSETRADVDPEDWGGESVSDEPPQASTAGWPPPSKAGLTVADAQLIVDGSGFGPWWGFIVESIEPGVARVRLPMRAELLRPGGVFQGAAAMCLADVAMWLALVSLGAPADTTVTLEEKTSYLRGSRTDITSEARVLKNGRRIMYGAASTYDAAGELVAHHTLTYAGTARNPA